MRLSEMRIVGLLLVAAAAGIAFVLVVTGTPQPHHQHHHPPVQRVSSPPVQRIPVPCQPLTGSGVGYSPGSYVPPGRIIPGGPPLELHECR
jgi:hypothetical protein